MGWAEDRVEDYAEGHRATWLERRALEHANPVLLALALAAMPGLRPACGRTTGSRLALRRL